MKMSRSRPFCPSNVDDDSRPISCDHSLFETAVLPFFANQSSGAKL